MGRHAVRSADLADLAGLARAVLEGVADQIIASAGTAPGRGRVPVPGDGGRVPVPGIPLWVGYAVVEVDPRTAKLRAHLRVGRARLLLWRVGCRLGHATLSFWRSLYVREERPATGGRTTRPLDH